MDRNGNLFKTEFQEAFSQTYMCCDNYFTMVNVQNLQTTQQPQLSFIDNNPYKIKFTSEEVNKRLN